MKTISIFTILLILFPASCFSQECEAFLSDSAMTHASVSLCIRDIANGNNIIEFNSGKSLIPASVLKLVTSAAALELLGPDHRFKTVMGYTGTIRKGRLEGDIIIKGGGDPAFGSERFRDYYQDFPGGWVAEIKKLGIKKIKGRIITDDSYFDYFPSSGKWLWEDLGNYYGAGAYGASVYENTCKIHFRTDSDSSVQAITGIEPAECKIDLTNLLKANGTTDSGYVYSVPYSTSGWVTGSIPDKMNDFVLEASVTDPPLLISRIMHQRLKLAGIKIVNEPSTARLMKEQFRSGDITVISEISSPALSEIIQQLNHRSINLYAEHLLKELGKTFRNNGTTVDGLQVVMDFLKSAGVKTDGFFIQDGSGLSPVNSINSAELVNLLIYMKKQGKYSDYYLRSLPEAGENETTLRNCFRDEVFLSALQAKSGSMSRVKSYAGYLTTKTGNELAFSVIVNNFTGPSGTIVSHLEEVLKDIILNK